MTLRIIGAGFGRTGTSSLQIALEDLGVGPCYHMMEVAAHPEHAALWMAAGRGESVDWTSLLTGYSAAVDWPACMFWRDILAAYPDARVILTVRDSATWYASFHDTILERMQSFPPLASPSIRALYDLSRDVILRRTFGGRADDAQHAINVFDAHNADVIATVEASRLLVYEVALGWEPLCRFLELPVPESPFPQRNARLGFAEGLRSRVAHAGRRLRRRGLSNEPDRE